MIRYKNFQPTAFDPRGLNCEEHGICEFFVLPVAHNRDSGVMTESNWHAALEMLGGESDVVQVHRFGHWANGWFELILIDPAAEDKVKTAEEIEATLADYPVLNDEDYSAREWEAAAHWWEHCGMRERLRICERFKLSCFAARHDLDKVSQLETSGELVYYLARD